MSRASPPEGLMALQPPPKLSVAQWADRERRLSSEASAEPGRWYTDRAPYLRGIMDVISDPTVSEVVVMSASQVVRTEALLNCIGFHIAHDPALILVIQPTGAGGMAGSFAKDRLAPMLRDTPALNGKVKDPRSRDSNNTTLHKKFPGGHISQSSVQTARQHWLAVRSEYAYLMRLTATRQALVAKAIQYSLRGSAPRPSGTARS